MSIPSFIHDSLSLLANRRFESAACLAMNSLDATAQQEYPHLAGSNHVKDRCTNFVRDNHDLIVTIGTGGAIAVSPGVYINLSFSDANAANPRSIEDILYILVRCHLTHEATLPPDTYFNENCTIGRTPTGFSIPVHLIYAVILAVVGAKTNRTPPAVAAGFTMQLLNQTIPIAECWGDKPKIITLLGIQ